jgi:type I restriction enzyme S subunit
MKIPEGYKQTEVGVIPEDWLTIKIGDLFGFKNGLNKAKEFFGTGTPIVNYMDVFNHPGLHKSDILGKVTVSTDEIRVHPSFAMSINAQR